MDRKNKVDTRNLYTVWGTTREEHMNRMLKFIECQNARVAEEEASVQMIKTNKVTGKKTEPTIGKRGKK